MVVFKSEEEFLQFIETVEIDLAGNSNIIYQPVMVDTMLFNNMLEALDFYSDR